MRQFLLETTLKQNWISNCLQTQGDPVQQDSKFRPQINQKLESHNSKFQHSHAPLPKKYKSSRRNFQIILLNTSSVAEVRQPTFK